MVQAVSPCLARYVRGSAPLMGLISFLSRRLLRRVVINDQARAAPYDLLPERALFRFGSDSVSPFDAARADPATSASKSSNSGLARVVAFACAYAMGGLGTRWCATGHRRAVPRLNRRL